MPDPPGGLDLPPQRFRTAPRQRWGDLQWFFLLAFVVLVTGTVVAGLATQLDDERTVNVLLRDGFTAADVDRLREACGTLPGIGVLPPPREDKASSRRYPIRFDIGGTSGNQVTALTGCLDADPLVRGVLVEGEPGG